MMSENIISIKPLKSDLLESISEQSAHELIPLLIKLSSKAKRLINLYQSQLAFQKTDSPKAYELQDKINSTIQTWSDHIRRLGLIPVDFGKVKIPVKGTLLYWEYPNQKLNS